MGRESDRRIAEWYNTLTPSYDELYGQEQSRKHDAVIDHLGKKRFELLVDIGCGTGTFLHRARQHYVYGVGLDMSMAMLRAAKKKRSGNIDLVLASAQFLPFKGRSVDCSVSISMMQADQTDRFLSEQERIARENSLLAISILQKPEVATLPPQSESSIKISEIETLYFVRCSTASA